MCQHPRGVFWICIELSTAAAHASHRAAAQKEKQAQVKADLENLQAQIEREREAAARARESHAAIELLLQYQEEMQEALRAANEVQGAGGMGAACKMLAASGSQGEAGMSSRLRAYAFLRETSSTEGFLIPV